MPATSSCRAGRSGRSSYDLGYMNDRGYVFVVDRLTDMIITGGENVYSAEVENALSKHPAVAACAVIGVEDAQWGERVHAVVVLQPGGRGHLGGIAGVLSRSDRQLQASAQHRLRRRVADVGCG